MVEAYLIRCRVCDIFYPFDTRTPDYTINFGAAGTVSYTWFYLALWRVIMRSPATQAAENGIDERGRPETARKRGKASADCT